MHVTDSLSCYRPYIPNDVHSERRILIPPSILDETHGIMYAEHLFLRKVLETPNVTFGGYHKGRNHAVAVLPESNAAIFYVQQFAGLA